MNQGTITATELRRGMRVADDFTGWAEVTDWWPLSGGRVRVEWKLATGETETAVYVTEDTAGKSADRFTPLTTINGYSYTLRGVTASHTSYLSHADHNCEEWHAYVSSWDGDPEWINGADSGVCCHDCRVIVVDR